MKISLTEIKIKREYLNLVPRMKPDDEKAFDASVKENGIRERITLNQDKVLLDGHSRYYKAKKYNIEFLSYDTRHFGDSLLEKKYVIEANLERRHLTNYQKVELGIPLLEIEQKLAERRMKESRIQNKDLMLGSNDPSIGKGKSTELIANKIGLSNATMMRGKVVHERATKEQKERLRSGRTSINSIYNQITRQERNLPKVSLPDGSWSVVMADLPIQFDDQGVRGSSSNNYDTIPIPDLKLGIFNGKDIRNLFNENCIIFAWFQASTIFYAKDILSSWGFECKTNQIWNKKRIGTGSWLANMHEHLVFAVKGKMPLPAERLESIQDVEPENRVHSSKPVYFYHMVEKLYPNRTYLDLFSRYKHNEKWTCFGNEFGDKKE